MVRLPRKNTNYKIPRSRTETCSSHSGRKAPLYDSCSKCWPADDGAICRKIQNILPTPNKEQPCARSAMTQAPRASSPQSALSKERFFSDSETGLRLSLSLSPFGLALPRVSASEALLVRALLPGQSPVLFSEPN